MIKWVLADLLNRIRAKGLAVFVDVDLHGLVTKIWNRKDYTNLKKRGSIRSIVELSYCRSGYFSDNSESELGRGAVKEKLISHLSEFF